MTTATHSGFKVEATDRSPGYNLPQKMGRALWAPMWLMALMAFAVGFVLAIVRASNIASGAAETTIAAQEHLVPAFMFAGFAAVFAAISFAIARILGEFRSGGGAVQEAAGTTVRTLKMPATAKLFILGMMMAMMILVIAVIIHFVWAANVAAGAVTIAQAETAAITLEGVRRIGVALYLVSIALGLVTITTVLRFQTARVAQLPTESNRA